jgi:hypothetical protein
MSAGDGVQDQAGGARHKAGVAPRQQDGSQPPSGSMSAPLTASAATSMTAPANVSGPTWSSGPASSSSARIPAEAETDLVLQVRIGQGGRQPDQVRDHGSGRGSGQSRSPLIHLAAVPGEPRQRGGHLLLLPVAGAVTPRRPAILSGHTTRHALTITKTGTEVISASRSLVADLIDPVTGQIVGGYVGPTTLELIIRAVAPGVTTDVPVLVGTTSIRPELGYAVPPGEWAATVTLGLAEQTVSTPPLPITVTDSPEK